MTRRYKSKLNLHIRFNDCVADSVKLTVYMHYQVIVEAYKIKNIFMLLD